MYYTWIKSLVNSHGISRLSYIMFFFIKSIYSWISRWICELIILVKERSELSFESVARPTGKP